MRSRQEVLLNFVSFLPKFGCYGNSLGFLEISDSIFEIADPENPTIHAKCVSISCTEMKLCLFECLSISCTEMKLCLFECLAYLYHCNFLDFFCEK